MQQKGKYSFLSWLTDRNKVDVIYWLWGGGVKLCQGQSLKTIIITGQNKMKFELYIN